MSRGPVLSVPPADTSISYSNKSGARRFPRELPCRTSWPTVSRRHRRGTARIPAGRRKSRIWFLSFRPLAPLLSQIWLDDGIHKTQNQSHEGRSREGHVTGREPGKAPTSYWRMPNAGYFPHSFRMLCFPYQSSVSYPIPSHPMRSPRPVLRSIAAARPDLESTNSTLEGAISLFLHSCNPASDSIEHYTPRPHTESALW